MSIFRWKDAPAPGEGEDRGALRPVQQLERDFGKFICASMLAVLGLIPYMVGVSFAVSTHSVLPLLLSGVLGGMAAAPQICGLVDVILRSLRDDVGLWWHTYRASWRRNLPASLAPGGIFGLAAAIQIFSVMHIGALEHPGVQLTIICITALLLLGIAGYLVPMLVLMELPLWALIKNALMLLLRNFPRSLLSGGVLAAAFFAMLLWFPFSAAILLTGVLWIPIYLSCKIVYPVLDRSFRLSERFAAMKTDSRP